MILTPVVQTQDNEFNDGADITKKVLLDLSGISSNTTRTLSVPDKSGTIAVTSDILGYALPILCGSISGSLVDGQSLHFGGVSGVAPSTTPWQFPIVVTKPGVVKAISLTAFAATPGSSEPWVLHIRKLPYLGSEDPVEEILVASVGLVTAVRNWLNISDTFMSVAPGEILELKLVNPSWVANPAGVSFGGHIYIETA